MWDEMSKHQTSSGMKRPGMKHPWYETEMVQNIQHLKGNVYVIYHWLK